MTRRTDDVRILAVDQLRLSVKESEKV
jgi:hypothetical protein